MTSRAHSGPDRSVLAHPALVYRDATPYSTVYGDIYKSRHGAFDEAGAVFVHASAIEQRWSGQPSCCVLEVGFGLGVNFLRTVQAWLADPGRCARLFYVSIECAPLGRDDLGRALTSLQAPDDLMRALLDQWPPALPGLHRLTFCDGRVQLQLAFGTAERMLPRLSVAADAIYLDGFAPARNADAWSETVIRAAARRARTGARLVTYTASARVRRTLEQVGFEVSLQPGFGGKKHRLQAEWRPRWRSYPQPAPPPAWPRREAIVIGAGLSGSACAAALARRGWRVQVLEQQAGIAGGGSSQPLCAEHLHLSPDDNPRARLSRAALRLARDCWPAGLRREIGMLWLDPRAEIAGTEPEMRSARMIEPLGFPTEFVSALSAGEASERAGLRLSRGGLWLPDCAVAEPAMLCRQWLSDPAITLHCKRCVDFLRPDGDGWAAFDADGALLATAPVVLLCNAQQAHRLTPVPHLTLAATLGQTSTLRPVAASDPGAGAAALNCVLSDEGYLVPGVGGDAGLWQSGSTYHPLDSPSAAREASAFATDDDRRNLERAARLIGPQAPALTVADHHQGVRWSAPDHLPLIGAAPDALQCHRQAAELARNDRLPLPRLHGVFQAFGFGSRGLLWSVLAGEVLAAAIEGEPAPIETDLLQAIDPARFPRRALRRAASR